MLLRTAHAVTRTGRGAVVLVTGEAGSGKSSVTRAFLDRVEGQLLVAAGGCDDLLAPRGLAPFRDMAEALPDLARALSAEGQPDDVFPALLRFVAARPTVLVVEDVHWADDVTLDAIRYLSRRIAGVPAILLLTFRPEDVGATHPLRGILGGLGSSSVRRLELAPLSVDAVRRLGGLDDGEAAEIHRVTHGNPFFVTEVLDAGVDAIPPTVRDAVLARVGRLPPAARRLVQWLAVVPSRAELWLAEALAGEDPDALAEAERSGVVSAGTDHVAFRHELARRAIETSLTVGERVRANREVLAGLLQRPHPEPSRIVHHAEHAVRPDLLARYGPIAADAAQHAGAHRQAAETLRVVLAHAEDLDATVRAVLLTRRAYSLYVVNDYDAALGVAESAVSLAEDVDDPVVLAEALMVLSRIVLFAGGPVRARAAAGRAVEILEPLGDDARLAAALIELARVHSNLATPGIVAQPSADAVRYAARALELCDRLDRDDLRAQALCYLGSGRLALGDPGGFDDIARAVAVGATDGPRETRVRTYVNAAGSAYRAGRFADARAYVATGLSLAADGEFAAGRVPPAPHLGGGLGERGRVGCRRGRAAGAGDEPGPARRDGRARAQPPCPRPGPARRPRVRRCPRGGARRPLGRRGQLRRRSARGGTAGGRLAHRHAGRRTAAGRAGRRAGGAVRPHGDARRVGRVPTAGGLRGDRAGGRPRSLGSRPGRPVGRRGRRVGGAGGALRAGGRAGLAGRRRRGPRDRPRRPGRSRRARHRPRVDPVIDRPVRRPAARRSRRARRPSPTTAP